MRAPTLAISIAVALFTASLLNAGDEAGEGGAFHWGSDPAVAAAEAEKTGRPVLVFLFAPDCPHCKRMGEESLPAPAVGKVLGAFVLLKVDAREAKSGGEHGRFVSDLVAGVRESGEKIRGVPALVVAEGDWKVIDLVEGFHEAGVLARRLGPLAEASEEFSSGKAAVESGEAGYEKLTHFLKACHILKRFEPLRKHGLKALAMERGEFHAEIAYYLASSYGPGVSEYDVYKVQALEWDGSNEKGLWDAFCADEAMRILRSIRTPADRGSKLARARKILEQRLTKPDPKLHAEKGQALYWVLAQIHIETGPSESRMAKEALRKGIALSPESDLSRTMKSRLAELGG